MMFPTSIGEKGSEAGVSIQNVISVRKVNTLRKIYLQPLSPFTSHFPDRLAFSGFTALFNRLTADETLHGRPPASPRVLACARSSEVRGGTLLACFSEGPISMEIAIAVLNRML
jgi:hypothetical protein